MDRTQIMLEPDIKQLAMVYARKRGISLAEVIRDALSAYLNNSTKATHSPKQMLQKMATSAASQDHQPHITSQNFRQHYSDVHTNHD